MDGATAPPAAGPKTFGCRRFVIESTDATWHAKTWVETEEAIHKYFAEDWQSVRAFGEIIDGREGLKSFMKDWLKGFPDVFIYVSDLFCEGNDIVGYKTTMPYVLTATNTGPSVYGAATGRRVQYHGLANCYIKKIDGRWQYTNEWDVPDMWSFLMQLNISIDSLKHPGQDLMTVDECKPLFEWGSGKMNWFPSPETARKFKVYGSSALSTGVERQEAVTKRTEAKNGAHSMSPSNNSCMDASTAPPIGPKTFDCRRFVIESTDATWHAKTWAETEEAIHKYFAEDWQSVRAFGEIIDGREGLKSFMKDWLKGFPDVFIYVSDLFCEGNDIVGYKTTMPYVLTATNTGPSVYGAATGRRVQYHGLANCYIKKIDGRWQYTNEWDVPDMWSFLTQLNVSIDSLQHPEQDLMTVDECKPLFEWGSGNMNWFPSPSSDVSRGVEAKTVVANMLSAGEGAHWAFETLSDAERVIGPYFTPNFTYDFIYPFNKSQGVAGWTGPGGEMHVWSTGFPKSHFTKFINAGDSRIVTVAAYANARWTGPFAGLPPAHKEIRIADIDYYLIEDGKIKVNWCLVDVISVLQQAGYKLLPPSKLPDHGYMPPNVMDALPAPQDDFVSEADTLRSRSSVMQVLHEDFLSDDPTGQSWAENMLWYGPPGVGTASSRKEYVTGFLQPLRAAFGSFTMAIDAVVCQGLYCGAHVHLDGIHRGEWLGQAATGKQVSLRLGLHWRFGPDGLVAQGWCVIDLLAAFAQMGVDLLERARSQTPPSNSEPHVVVI